MSAIGSAAGATMRRGAGRNEILQAARQEFARLGYAGASTAQIARVAGVAQPLVHHHFGSKLGLWEATLDEVFSPMLAMIAAARAERCPDEGYGARFARLLRALVRFVALNPELPRIATGASGEASEALWARWDARLHATLVEELQAAVADRAVGPGFNPIYLNVFLRGVIWAPTLGDVAPRVGFDVSDPAQADAYADTVVRATLFGVLER